MIESFETHDGVAEFEELSSEEKWDLFVKLFNDLGAEMVEHTKLRGFDPENLHVSSMLMNQVSEAAEAHEAWRCGNPSSKKIAGFSHLEEEEADLLLRVMIDASAKSWKTSEAAIAKNKFNKTRPRMHGGKKF